MDIKIFGIGLDKTGTTSLHNAFKLLGIKSVHYKWPEGNIKDIIANNNEKGINLLTGIDHYEAFSDWGHPSTHKLFIKFDQQYPNSKFIYTIRSLDDWLNSREKHVKRISNLKYWQNKFPDDPWYNIDKTAWKEEFESHHQMVLEYFKTRTNDLLILDITKGDGWAKLCPFLKHEMPSVQFPSKNKSKKRTGLHEKIKQKMKHSFLEKIFFSNQ